MIRLRAADQIHLGQCAAARGMLSTTYVSALTRAHLRSLAPLAREALLALMRTLGELGSIGRNLHRIAAVGNRGQFVTTLSRNGLEAMLRVCGTRRHCLKPVFLAT